MRLPSYGIRAAIGPSHSGARILTREPMAPRRAPLGSPGAIGGAVHHLELWRFVLIVRVPQPACAGVKLE